MEQKSVPLVLVVIISVGFFGLMGVLAFHTVPAENKDALEAMLGILGTAFTGLVGYYFGSSVNKTPQAPLATPTQEQGKTL